MGGFSVIIENLETASKKLHHVTRPLAGYDFDPDHVTSHSFGHTELAAWFDAVADQCGKAGRALHDGAETLSATLDAKADAYRSADQYSVSLSRSMPELVPTLVDGNPSPAPTSLREVMSR